MITILIPSFNQEKYLAEAIESAITQNEGKWNNKEVIVVDDGSTDNSLAIAKRYEGVGVKIISQVNKGLASARNTGIMNAKGDWILLLDSDDILLPHALDEIQKVVVSHPEADIIAPSFKEFGERDREIILMPNPTLEDFKTGNRIGYFSAIKRSALLQVGGYSPRMDKGYEDYHLWFDLLKRGKLLITIPEILVHYRVKKESMYTESVKHHEELMNQIFKDHA